MGRHAAVLVGAVLLGAVLWLTKYPGCEGGQSHPITPLPASESMVRGLVLDVCPDAGSEVTVVDFESVFSTTCQHEGDEAPKDAR